MTFIHRSSLSTASSHGKLPILGEGILVTFVACALAARLHYPVLWILVPLPILWLRREPLTDYGLVVRFRPPSFVAHAAIGIGTLILYTIGYRFFIQGQDVAFHVGTDWPILLFAQLFAVALPEEFFFRGYLQTRFNQALARPYALFGAQVGCGLLLQAGLFALCHLPLGAEVAFRVFFFAVLAGWLRDRSGSILAPSIYHGLGNTWAVLLQTQR